MGREIKFSLVYRDMWQSSGKYMPRKDQLVRVAQPIIDMGCFERVETNGGGFEQINLLYGQNPNHSVREWTAPFRKAGIQTHMLERGLNGIRMSPVPKDVRRLMFKLKKIQGTDIARSFDGLNNSQNLELSFQYAKEGGMIAQGALSITHSPIHTADYYIKLADAYIEKGAEEICLKDMAGIARPVTLGKIVKGIRERHPNIILQYHGHSTPGFSVASALEAARHGVDYVDVGMEPLSWGTGHTDLLTAHAMLTDAGFSVPDINMEAYMEVRALTQEFIDDFLGYFINPKNRKMNSMLIAPGLPGGMMGSLMADLEQNLKSLNKWLMKRDKKPLSQDDLLLKLFNEVQYVWPKLGYPCLVTPYSQYVKNVALMNVLQMEKGKERWSMMDENTWAMILGQSGQLAGPLDNEILTLAKDQEREFFTGNPQDLYPDELDSYKSKMDENGWEYGLDDEELFEYAMHPAQYEDYRSGKAEEKFNMALEEKRNTMINESASTMPQPQIVDVEVDGKKFQVNLAWTDAKGEDKSPPQNAPEVDGPTKDITAPIEGKFFIKSQPSERGLKVGDKVKKGDTIAYIESMKVLNAITSEQEGTVVDITLNHGDDVEEDEVIVKLS
jgi:pyruvate carboxylase subunit B